MYQITADGSINCVDNPGEQEALVAQLVFCETVTALALLRQKGSFILKTFTTLEHHTVCLLYIINCCFSEVILKLRRVIFLASNLARGGGEPGSRL